MTGSQQPPEWKVNSHSRRPNGVLQFELTSPTGATWDAYVGPGTQWTFALRHLASPEVSELDEMMASVTRYILRTPIALEDAR